MHVGHRNVIDLDFTVRQLRSFDELTSGLLPGPEREYFSSNPILHAAFPCGKFHCWGVPSRARPSFMETSVGDAVFFAPWIGLHGGCIRYVGIIKAICDLDCLNASRVLWPKTPDDRLFPLLFFFDTEEGKLPWYDFLDDLKIGHRWNPRGWYRRIDSSHFDEFGGVKGYVDYLRKDAGFSPGV